MTSRRDATSLDAVEQNINFGICLKAFSKDQVLRAWRLSRSGFYQPACTRFVNASQRPFNACSLGLLSEQDNTRPARSLYSPQFTAG